ncbi:hypothetical protein [Ammoniphilus resinae]|uniref:Uncharacterized protein n=1 Tax=Ammoniphilus resinae TaxID=861532 RepID=A0ABS4GVG7_9BACL|nr:hypothetical protein [Ammoniphilus resinae]MBP1934254.1 hypothetical protein [Ammoniphilus resinae]
MQVILTVTHIASLICIALFSLLASFIGGYVFEVGLCVSSLFLILVLLVKTKGFVRASYTFFFFLSLGLSFYYEIPLEQMVKAIISNAEFILLFVCVPLIKIPIVQGNYMEQLLPLVRNLSMKRLHPILVFTNFGFSSFLNFGGYRIVHEFFQDVMKDRPLLYGKILSRSFSLGAFWTPYYGAFSIAVAYSHAKPASIIGFGLLICLLILFVWSAWLYKKAADEGMEPPAECPEIGRLYHLPVFFGLLIGSVILLNQWVDLGVIVIVSMMSVAVSVIWCLYLGKFKEFLKSLRGYGTNEMLFVREEAFLFISIGFLAKTLLYLDWKIELPELHIGQSWLLFFFILLFGFIVIGLAQLGIHHLVTITLFNTSLHMQSMGIEPVVYALIILMCWAISPMLSPFSPANLLTARITGKTTMEIGVKGNGRFGLACLVFGAIFLTVVQQLVG